MADLEALRRRYDEGTRYVEAVVAAASPGDLDRHAPGAWSARQTIHHLADSETMAYTRLRRLLAESDPVIQGYDEGSWANAPVLGYAELPVDAAVALYGAVRRSSASIVARLTEADLERAGNHTEGGRYTVRRWLEIYTEHPFDHGAQFERALRGEP
ncbi:MAG: hypothetical protein RL338_854 [Chloroflexota bacterium]